MHTAAVVLAALVAVCAAAQAAAPPGGDADLQELNRKIRRYSNQAIIALDIDEEYTFTLNSGARKTIRLVSVTELRDSVIKRVRRADVRVRINAKPCALVCAPYGMPTEIDGLRIQADTTSGWRNIRKRAQLSLWDAADPIVNTDRFGFPVSDYLLFSHGMQAYNEVVHLGRTDGTPKGPNFYHDYGVDTAGYEGKEEIISCVDGEVIKFWPSREKLCSVVIQDAAGLIWSSAHLDSIYPHVKKGAHIKRGQKIGLLGKTGPSGNFAHLHLGTYLSEAHMAASKANRRLNLYPWLVTAYEKQHRRGLYAVARPHHAAFTGEEVRFDASNSLAFGSTIASYRWELPDGQTIRRAKAQKAFDRAGTYIATLWVKNEKGAEDVDFCTVRVYTRSARENVIPTIFMTYTPTRGIRIGQPVLFRFWLQGARSQPIEVDFGEGTVIGNYNSYSVLEHSFKAAGVHIVTARTTVAGRPVMQKLKVVVGR